MTTESSSILVVGSTGYLGMEICRQLTSAHKNVTGLVRKTSAVEKVTALKEMGVRTVEGDLKDPASIKNALKGISVVISTASSTFSRADGDSIASVDLEGQSNLVDDAIAAGVKQYVFISFPDMGEGNPLQVAKRKAEAKIKAASWTYTILYPSFFMEIWLTPHIGFDYPNNKATIYGEGKNKISWIALRDVAAFAVASLDSPFAKNKIVPIGGPVALSPLEVVDIFEKKGSKKFEIQHVPYAALEGQKAAAADDMSIAFACLMLCYANGNEIKMDQTMKEFKITLASVHQYAEGALVGQSS